MKEKDVKKIGLVVMVVFMSLIATSIAMSKENSGAWKSTQLIIKEKFGQDITIKDIITDKEFGRDVNYKSYPGYIREYIHYFTGQWISLKEAKTLAKQAK